MSDIYDGAFRTIVNDCKQFVLPFINEVFGEAYDGTELIEFHPNEHFIDQLEEPDKRRITDTNFSVIGRQIFPHTAVPYLRDTKKTPDRKKYTKLQK